MGDRGAVTEQTLKAFLEAFNRHDLDAIMEFFGDECTLDAPRGPDPWGRCYSGKEEVRRGLRARLEGIPNVRYGEDRHWVCGNRAVSEWRLTGTTTDGVHVDVRGCDLLEFRDGKIARKDAYWKMVE
ncbi:MAG: nuclear transport factor 2 family protein [Thermoplasmata archaeon]